MKYLMTFNESVNFSDQVLGTPQRGMEGLGIEGDIVSGLEIDGKKVGVIHYRIEGECFHVIWLDIRDEFRGNKYGNLLIEEIIKRAKENKSKYVKLEVMNTNKIAINLYKKYGFKVDSQKGFFFDMILDL